MGCDKKADSFTPVRKSHKTVTDEHDYDDSSDICDKPCLASVAPILSKLSFGWLVSCSVNMCDLI